MTRTEIKRDYLARKREKLAELMRTINFIACDGLIALHGGEKDQADAAFRRIIATVVNTQPEKMVVH